ncbi:hypothetical protein FLBR109950_10545 [Flavobacterium branchiophilum]|uniref:Membrane protein YkgB n=2 Tax=Flavobacterium branchiophilum TaxID=55197 RepID=G2Z586_FLABF|nr:hypothetical protein [Flavobacterium branchiophilum]PDS25569.1 hypothetical protein B0A77_04575 [Flavobacterium branchiophilum]CCB68592.1 Probable transmembrane protein of unknown function [Flavobacterium branchiophilum FL-15]
MNRLQQKMAYCANKFHNKSIFLLKISLALVYIWFGCLKIVGNSPAEALVSNTVYWWQPETFIPILGLCEMFIGLGLLISKILPYIVILLLLHMIVTFFPIIILKETCFSKGYYFPTLVGQYIIKNIVLIAGALTVFCHYIPSAQQANE